MSNNCQEYPFVLTTTKNVVKRIKCGDEGDLLSGSNSEFCGDCGAKIGEYHKENCDIERCPICGCQLLSCNCWTAYSK